MNRSDFSRELTADSYSAGVNGPDGDGFDDVCLFHLRNARVSHRGHSADATAYLVQKIQSQHPTKSEAKNCKLFHKSKGRTKCFSKQTKQVDLYRTIYVDKRDVQDQTHRPEQNKYSSWIIDCPSFSLTHRSRHQSRSEAQMSAPGLIFSSVQ